MKNLYITNASNRRGAVLVAVMVCLFVVSLLSLTMLKAIIARQQQLRFQQYQLQALWLSHSATELAKSKLSISSDYDGEIWRIDAGDFSRERSGFAIIRVSTVNEKPNQRRIIVEAYYPDHPTDRVLHQHEMVATISRNNERQ